MMKNTLKSIMFLAACTLLFTGCATPPNLMNSGDYIKETIPHKRTCFSRIRATEDNGEFRVSGKLRVKGIMRVYIPDFVEVALVDQDARVIEVQKAAYYPRVLTGRKLHKEAGFSVRFAKTPPAGTRIRVSNVNWQKESK